MKKNTKLLLLFLIPFILLNPTSLSYLLNQIITDPTTYDKFMIGIYAIGWGFIGIWFILPIFWKRAKPEIQKQRTIDEIIDDCWKEHERDKNG